MEKEEILDNFIRNSILGIIYKEPATISFLHKNIKKKNENLYDYKAIYKQVMILKSEGYVELNKQIKKQGKPVYVMPTLSKKKMDEYILKILREIKKRGQITFEEMRMIIPFSNDYFRERLRALSYLQYGSGYLEILWRITPEGEKFLEQNGQ